MQGNKLPEWITQQQPIEEEQWSFESQSEEEPIAINDPKQQPTQDKPQMPALTALQEEFPSQQNIEINKEPQSPKQSSFHSIKPNSSNYSFSELVIRRREGLKQERDYTLSQIFSSSEEKTVIAMDHIVQLGQDSSRSQRISEAIRDIEDGKMTVRESIQKMNYKDLDIVSQHRLLLNCLQDSILLLVKYPSLQHFRKCDFFQVLDHTYKHLSCKIDFPLLKQSLSDSFSLLYKQLPTHSIQLFSKKIAAHTECEFQRKRLEKKRIRNKKLRSLHNPCQNRTNQITLIIQEGESMNDKHNQDGKSEYGVFNNEEEEFNKNLEGIYNYRLHRTIKFLEQITTIDTYRNIERSKDYAFFIIKLTNAHLQNILKETILDCQLTLQNKVSNSYAGIQDEVSYFSQGKYQLSQHKLNPQIKKSLFPSRLTHYNQLRYSEMIQQNKLHRQLFPELFITLSRTQSRSQKIDKYITEYFESPEISPQTIQEHKVYRKPNPPTTSKIKIETEHIANVLESHPHYQNSQVLWRLRTVY